MQSRTGVRRRRVAAALAALLFIAARDVHAQPATPSPRRLADHVILVSIDGLVPEAYLRPHEYAMPNLQALRAEGSWAEGVIGQYPSLTYPSHVSIATGVRPARHGVTQNTMFDPATGSRQWVMNADAVKVPAVWDVTRATGATTAAFSWPVTAGAAIDSLTERLMHTGLVMAGAGIRKGIAMPLARQIDVAPTVARLLGATMNAIEGVPMVGILTEGEGGR